MLAAGHAACGCATTGRRRAAPCTSARRITCAGTTGRVVRHLGDFRNPEDLAFARPAATLPLYHVAFDAAQRSGPTRRRRRDRWSRSSSIGWRRHEHPAKPTASACSPRCARLLAEKGIVTPDEIAERIAHHRRRLARRRARAWWRAPGSTRTTAR